MSGTPVVEDLPQVVTPAALRGNKGRKSPSLIAGLTIVGLFVLVALVSLVWTPEGPLVINLSHVFAAPSGAHLLGTDRYGRDELSRLMAGASVSLYVGFFSVLIGSVVGIPAGLWAASMGGVRGEALLRVADIIYAFPALLLAIVLAAAEGASKNTATLAIGIAFIPVFVRVTRSMALGVLESEFVTAARAYGRSRTQILIRHVVPNIATTVVAQMSLLFSVALLAEAGLDYLGLATKLPTASWGTMLSDAQNSLSNDAMLSVYPSICIFVAVLGFALLSEGISDYRDSRIGR